MQTAILTMLVTASAQADTWTTVNLEGGTTGLRLTSSAAGEQVVVEVAEARLSRLPIDGHDWAVVEVPGAANLMQRGRPSLPFLSSEYLLDATGGIHVELVSVDEHTVDLNAIGCAGVAPSKGHLSRTIDPATVAWSFDREIYEGAKPFPAETAWVAEPFIAGPLRGQSLRFPVVRWDPVRNTLHIVQRAVFRVIPDATAPNPRTRAERSLTAPFADLVRARSLNPERLLTRDARFVEAGRLAILAAPELVEAATPLAEWETLVGYPTLLASTADVGADVASIQSWIQGLYDSADGLSWVILVGDYPQIPNPTGVNEGARCDPCYAKLEGNDNRPDIAISRLSAQTPQQAAVQVNKILDYEQNPDTGSAATWYGAAFGIASSEGSPADWERMNELRDVLLPYGYTEFTELYDGALNPDSADVAAAVNEGRSLGLYIGHGASTYWVSSGFSVSDVNSLLTNDGMLPVVWDVACVNGTFHMSSGDCFAEAWLKKEGGGAVSFEAATTNESWVPPCVAQRAIVDSVVERTAFTTGAQHLGAKLHLFDVEGDGDSSEGTMWAEQSHLFGACTLWPRTAAPLPPDEPTDFAVAGGIASLTVTVDGAPLTTAGGAIVSFLTQEGDSWILLGSGLVGADGRVEASVAGDPTHCHIHGRDLVPQIFELAARPEGRISLDQTTYSCSSNAVVRVADSNVPGASPDVADTVQVHVQVSDMVADFDLVEDAADSGFYSTTINLSTVFGPLHGDTLEASYQDADPAATARATASFDCAGPSISGVQLSASSDRLQIDLSTDEAARVQLRYGSELPLTETVIDDQLKSGARSIIVDGVSSCTDYMVEMAAVDAFGNATVDDNNGDYWRTTSSGWATLLDEPFDSDPGWTVVNGGSSSGWQFGQPQGHGGAYGGPDPSSGATGDFVYGINLNGDYSNNHGNNQLQLITPVVDCSQASEVHLGFQRWLGVEQPLYDHARIQVSADGGAWTTVWENEAQIADSSWTPMDLDLTSLAAGHASVQVRWTLGTTDGSWTFCGWNLDDVTIEAAIPCVAPPDTIFADGFESANCTAWSGEAPGGP